MSNLLKNVRRSLFIINKNKHEFNFSDLLREQRNLEAHEMVWPYKKTEIPFFIWY
jgi:hypothetical protein